MKKVFITGGSGYIGSSLISLMAGMRAYKFVSYARNHKEVNNVKSVKYINGDIMDQNLLKSSLDGSDIIIHLAGGGGDAICVSNPVESTLVNILGTQNLVNAAKVCNIKKIIFSSSVYVYTSYSNVSLPIDEKNVPNPDSFYGSIKFAAEEIIKNSGINYVICRLSNIYGAGSGVNIPMGALGNFIKAVNTNTKMQVYGDGNNIIDYVHINDAINAIESTFSNRVKNKIYNIGGNEPISIEDLAILIKKMANEIGLDYKEDIKKVKSSQKKLSDLWLNIEKMKNDLNWYPKIDLENGIKNLIVKQIID